MADVYKLLGWCVHVVCFGFMLFQIIAVFDRWKSYETVVTVEDKEEALMPSFTMKYSKHTVQKIIKRRLIKRVAEQYKFDEEYNSTAEDMILGWDELRRNILTLSKEFRMRRFFGNEETN